MSATNESDAQAMMARHAELFGLANYTLYDEYLAICMLEARGYTVVPPRGLDIGEQITDAVGGPMAPYDGSLRRRRYWKKVRER